MQDASMRRRVIVVVVATCAVVLAGCSASIGGGGVGSPSSTVTSSPGSPQTSTTTPGPTGSSPGTGGQTSPDEPVYGGTLRYGLEADSLNPWTPQFTALAVSGYMVMRSVFDPLAMPTEDLEIEGYLLSDLVPNDDATVWTLTVRDGITFHDGTPLNGDAVAANLEAHRASPVTGNFVTDIDSVAADGQVVTVTMRRPWAAFPTVLTGQVGYVASPTWLAAVAETPAKALEPVGTGPFVFESYRPGAAFTATRNPEYWREGLPYLDRVEFYPLRNIRDRSQALLDGDVDIIHTANGDEIAKFRGRLGAFDMVEAREFGETTYVLLNVGNPESPVSDVRVRRAMAHALDYELIKTARNGDVFEVANGPFQPGAIGHLAETGFPEHDSAEAARLVAEWEEENGPLEITFTTTSDEFNLISAELYASLWEAVGIEVELETIDQSEYIGFALAGNFEAYFWRLHSGFDPDQQFTWWHSSTAREFGTPGTNFGRIRDDVIDENLETIRIEQDPDVRRRAAEAINLRFADQVYDIWLGWAITGIVFHPYVNDVNTGFTLPSGEPVLPTGVGIGGTHQLAQIWLAP